MPVADGGLTHLRDQRLGVAQKELHQLPTPLEFALQDRCLQPIALSRALYDRPAGGRIAAHEQRDADDSLVAHHCNFSRSAAFQDIQERDDGIRRKVHMLKLTAGLVDRAAEWHRNRLQMSIEATEDICRQSGEQVILARIGGA